MPIYRIEVAKPASRQIAELNRETQKRIVQRLEDLASEPRPAGCKKLANSEYLRIRVGDYRVVYSIEDQRLLVLVIRVAHRREVYR
jgi:mRNA interferase RelE/StbE